MATRLGPTRATTRAGLLVELRLPSGEIGRGEAAPAYWLDGSRLDLVETELRAFAASRAACRLLESYAIDDVSALPATLSPAARCALDTALLDVTAQRRGMSVTELLGGAAETALDVGALLVGETSDAIHGEAATLVARGFGVLKLKVGGVDAALDVARIRAARAGGGGAVRLRLDANRAWDESTACEVLAAVASPDVEYVEEPLRTPEPAALARLRRRTGVALAMDESVRTADCIMRFAACGACDVIVLKLVRIGGPRAALALARHARALGLQVALTDSIETIVGRSATVHVAAALSRPHRAVGLGGTTLLARDVTVATAPEAGPQVLARGPGLGLQREAR